MGSGNSKREETNKKDDSKRKVQFDSTNELNDNTRNKNPKNIVEPKNENPGSDDYRKHKEKFDDENVIGANAETNETDKSTNKDVNERDNGLNNDENKSDNAGNNHENKSNNDENKSDNAHSFSEDKVQIVGKDGKKFKTKAVWADVEGILCSETHACENEKEFDENTDFPVETEKEVTEHLKEGINNAVKNIQKEDEKDNNQPPAASVTTTELSFTETSQEPGKKFKKRRVTWSNKVTVKNDDGTISEEEPKRCDSCHAVYKKNLESRKIKVEFTKHDPEKDKDSASGSQEEDSTRELYICDSCDLQKSKEALKDKNKKKDTK